MTSAAKMPNNPTTERIKEIRELEQCSIQDAQKIAQKEVLGSMIEHCFTMNDVRATMRKMLEFL